MHVIDLKPLKLIPFTDNYQGYRTSFSGYLFSSLTLIFVSLFYLLGNELWLKQNPFVFESEKYNPTPILLKEYLNVSFSHYLLPTETTKDLINVDIKKYFEFKLAILDSDKSRANNDTAKLTEIQTLKLSECTSTPYFQENTNNLRQYYLADDKDYMCISNESSKIDYTLKSKLGGSKFKILSLGLMPCVNNTESENCAPEDKIKTYINNLYIHIIISNNYIESKNLTDPVQRIFFSKLLELKYDSKRKDIFYYKPFTYTSDEGLLYEQNLEYAGGMISRSESEFFFSKEKNDYKSETIITLEESQVYIKRSYTKVAKVFADVLAMLNIFTLIFGTVAIKFNMLHFYDGIFNKLESKYKSSLEYVKEKKTIEMKFIDNNMVNNSNLNESNRSKNTKNSSLIGSSYRQTLKSKNNNYEYDNNINKGKNIDKIESSALKNISDNIKIKDDNYNNNIKNLKDNVNSSARTHSTLSFISCLRFYSNLNCCFTNKTLKLKKMERYFQYLYSFDNLFMTLSEYDIIKKLIFNKTSNSSFNKQLSLVVMDQAMDIDQNYKELNNIDNFNKLNNVYLSNLKLCINQTIDSKK